MTDTKVQRFKIAIPILKTSVSIVKDKKGNDVEERYLDGVASGTDLDLHGDRMAPSAIESMAKSLKQHVVNLNNEHDTSWSSEIGDINELTVTDNNNLTIKAKLNKMSTANDLWYALTEQNKKLGLSIGGYVKDYEMVKEGEGKDEKWVRLYKKIDLDHIAVTSRPAYPKAWVSNIAKSINEENDKLLIKKIKKENKEKSRRNEQRKQFTELARSIVRSIQNMEADLLLELVEKGLTFLDEKQILLIERSLAMTKKDPSLEADKSKKDEAKKTKSEGKNAEKSAAPENEKSKKKVSKVKKSKTNSKEKKVVKTKISKEKVKKSKTKKKNLKDSGKKEPSVTKKVKTLKVKSEKEPKKSKEAELVKTVKELSKSLKTVLSGYEELQEKVEKLETQPSSRKTVEVKRTLGDEETEDKSVDELKKARDKEIKEIRKNFVNDGSLFARIQRVRAEYDKRLLAVE